MNCIISKILIYFYIQFRMIQYVAICDSIIDVILDINTIVIIVIVNAIDYYFYFY